ncbi:MAG: glycosyltransferase family 9 protein [Acidobacteriota bacterium]
MQILVLHPGALGDIILSLPALQILREKFPNAGITLAADIDSAGAIANGYADQILSLSSLPLHRLFRSGTIPPGDELLWRSYDRIISWTGFGAEAFAKQFTRLHPHVLVAAWKPEVGDGRHVARLFIDSLRPWLIPPPAIPLPEIRLDAAARLGGAEWLREQGWQGERPLFALNPGAGSAAKRWPPSRFLELGQRLRTVGDLLIIEGPAEPGLGRDLAGELGPGAYLAANLPLRSLAAVLSHCRVFVGNDSGISHLAAGLRIGCVVLFGPTLPEHWGPLGPQVTVLRDAGNCVACVQETGAGHACLECIPTEAVGKQIDRLGVLQRIYP